MASRTTFDPEREITDRIIAAMGHAAPAEALDRRVRRGAFPLRVTGERYRGINAALCKVDAEGCENHPRRHA